MQMCLMDEYTSIRIKTLSHLINLSLTDAPDASVEVQMLFSSQQVVQSINLRAIADIYPLRSAIHDVHHPPETRHAHQEKTKTGTRSLSPEK